MDASIDVTKLPAVDEHVEYGKTVIAQAQEFAIETAEDMQTASDARQGIKDRQKAITSLLEPFVKAAHALHKSHTTRRKEIIAPLEEAEKIISTKMIEWQAIEDARIREEQKKKDEEAKLEAAIKAEEEGSSELANAIMEDQVPVTSAPIEKPKTNGVSFTETWTYEIDNEAEIPREFLCPDEKKIKAYVTSQKSLAQIAGVRIFPKKGIKSATRPSKTPSW